MTKASVSRVKRYASIGQTVRRATVAIVETPTLPIPEATALLWDDGTTLLLWDDGATELTWD